MAEEIKILECNCVNSKFSLDYHCMQTCIKKYADSLGDSIARSFKEMEDLENGALVNLDEERMVGHYWLRNASIAPTEKIAMDIESSLASICDFTEQIHSGKIAAASGKRFKHLIVAGIGGSQLGFQFLAEAMKSGAEKMIPHTIDNSDPEGIETLLAKIGDELSETLVIFISKSGGTVEVKNMIIEVKAVFAKKDIPFEKHFVAITMARSSMHKMAEDEKWLAVFPTWDWVGGRVSVMSSVGLLPLSLLGVHITQLLDGAKAMDILTREKDAMHNPAMLLAVIWNYFLTEKKITTMVTLPYKDRLSFFSRYLQQLVMESLGKEKTRRGNKIHAGLTVYGNKGSTDQHAYVQQLREGVRDFFTIFFLVKKDRGGKAPIVNHSTITTGDYLWAFGLGTQQALFERGRESVLITMDEITPNTLGGLIALFERAVGFYASMLNINAYNQPGVEAGKVCAEDIVTLQEKVKQLLQETKDATPERIAQTVGSSDLRLIRYLVWHCRANQ